MAVAVRCLLLAILVGLGPLGPAMAESPVLPPAPFKSPASGTRMVWENVDSGERKTVVFLQPEGMIVRFDWAGQRAATVGHFCPDCLDAGIGADGGAIAGLYPLAVGKGIRFTRNRGNLAWKDTIIVGGTDRITVPAGSFDTYVVWRRSRTPDDSWRAEQRNWYAPELGWMVRVEGFSSDGRRDHWQLVEVN